MKRLVFGLAIIGLFGASVAKADPYDLDKSPPQLEDFWFGLPYSVIQGTITLSGSTTFYGYATFISLKAQGGQIAWSVNYSSSQVGQLFNGDSFSDRFHKPVSSPTILSATLPSGTTLQYYIGGLKQK